jgi:small-conductance mechanosensitive channel
LRGDIQPGLHHKEGYLPNASGTLFDNSADMVDSSQLVNLGSFSASTGGTVNFNPASLLTFIQADTNDIVTFAITRNTQNDLNSVLLDNTSLTPPTLTIIP